MEDHQQTNVAEWTVFWARLKEHSQVWQGPSMPWAEGWTSQETYERLDVLLEGAGADVVNAVMAIEYEWPESGTEAVTALHAAVRWGYSTRAVEMLLAHPAVAPDTLDSQGSTALMSACWYHGMNWGGPTGPPQPRSMLLVLLGNSANMDVNYRVDESHSSVDWPEGWGVLAAAVCCLGEAGDALRLLVGHRPVLVDLDRFEPLVRSTCWGWLDTENGVVEVLREVVAAEELRRLGERRQDLMVLCALVRDVPPRAEATERTRDLVGDAGGLLFRPAAATGGEGGGGQLGNLPIEVVRGIVLMGVV